MRGVHTARLVESLNGEQMENSELGESIVFVTKTHKYFQVLKKTLGAMLVLSLLTFTQAYAESQCDPNQKPPVARIKVYVKQDCPGGQCSIAKASVTVHVPEDNGNKGIVSSD